MGRVTRLVTVHQLLGMTAPELLERAAALREAPPLPSDWAARLGDVLEEQAALADALAPLRVELYEANWQHLGVLICEGLEPDQAAALVGAGTPS